MAHIPIPRSAVSARSLRTNVGGPNTQADPMAFGEGIADATANVANSLGNAATAASMYEEQKRKEQLSNKVAQSDFTRTALETRNEVGPDGAGLQERTLEKFDQFVDEQANSIEDDKVRKAYKDKMAQQRNQWSSTSAQYEFSTAAQYSKDEADKSVSAVQNKIMTDPSMYETYVEQGLEVIEARPGLNATVKNGMKIAFKQESAKARFEGELSRAQSVDDLDRISTELITAPSGKSQDDGAKDWSKEFAPQDFNRMIDTIGNTRKAFVTKADTDARAALDTIEDRVKDVPTLINNDELAAVQTAVKQSANPITISRMARIMRDQQIIRETQKLAPGEIRAQINQANGNPATAYPGVPPRVSTAINESAKQFGVSPGYLGATVVREYGGNFKRTARQTDPKFAPTIVHGGVDIRNMKPEAVEALTTAGQLFGRPLPVTSGFRDADKQAGLRAANPASAAAGRIAKDSQHTHGDAVDVSTAGMSPEEKGKLTGALVDAGFTAIGEYGTHIHADMRGAVPASFGDREGKTWGGWTYLSPEVAQQLKDRGYGPNTPAADIKRALPMVQMSDDIDYGRGTDMTKDDGRPSSGAEGVMQFIPGTFLQTMKTPGVAAKMGVDIANMSDDQILALRKNPEISVMAGAALAAENKRIVESAIGRPVSDPELYMAHFLGSGGAVSLISGQKVNPSQSAAQLLPKAASANKPVFYDKNGRERSVQEVYNNIAREFGTAPSKVAYEDNATRQKVADNTKKAIDTDPMKHAGDVGLQNVTSVFDEGGMQARGQAARSVADYYSIPLDTMKPLTVDEVGELKKKLDDGNADTVLQVVGSLQGMGGDMARAALKQLGEKDNVYGYAGSLLAASSTNPNSAVVGSDIIRGQKRLQENPDIRKELPDTPSMLSAFTAETGNALNGLAPRERQTVQDAVLAHYVETHQARKGQIGALDTEAYAASVQAVMGGSRDAPSVAEVNGGKTILPPGVKADEIEHAMSLMRVDDWAEMSPQKLPPRYVDGTLIEPKELADEAQLQAVGGGQYKLMLSDGSFAVTGQPASNGRMEAYLFQPTADAIKSVTNRPASEDAPAAEQPAFQTEEDRLRAKYGVMYNYDENGRWLGVNRGESQ